MSTAAQRSFSAGEVAPSLYARTDLQKYTTALRTCRNFLCLRDGGAANRPGTEFVGLAPTGAPSRLLPFVFNDEQSYVLEFSNGLLRIIQDGAYLEVDGTILSVATPYSFTVLRALQIAQSADVLTIVHPNHPVMELRRLGALSWTLTAVDFDPGIESPANLVMDPPTGSGLFISWVVTAISEATGAESFPSASVGIASIAIPVARDLSWDAVDGAVEYRIYKAWGNGTEIVGRYGFVGTSTTTRFRDQQITPDFFDSPPADRHLFAASDDYPGAVAQYQQRRILGGTMNGPETFWTSRAGDLDNFTVSAPIQDDDAITGTLVSRKVNAIRHLVDADTLFVLTSGGEWVLRGDGSGILRPTDINALNFSKHGTSLLPPIVIDRRVLYVQARQSIVREIVTNEVGPGYTGANLTLPSSHLFKGYTLLEWAYQEEPHSIVWCVRSDGVLLGLTDLEEQQILAWHRHDTDGLIESVCVIPEGDEERLYLVVHRAGVRMVERMASRFFTDVRTSVFADASLSYNGHNTGVEYMRLTDSETWAYDELVTVRRSDGGFSATEIGNAMHFIGTDGTEIRVQLTEYVSGTVMKGFPNITIPAVMQGAVIYNWTRAVDVVSGLDHLEGREVSVTGDGYVVASPNNPAYTTPLVVTDGAVTLPRPYGRICVGLPYISDLETLDIDTPSGPSLKAEKLLANGLIAYLEQSRGFFAGQSLPTGDDPVEDMDELKVRNVSDEFGLIALQTDADDVSFPAGWNSNGRVAIRNVDPIPLTVLAVMPRGQLSSTG